MPSFLELLESAEEGGPPPPPPDLLATVKAEGGRRRRRRQRRNLAVGGIALVLVAVPVLAVVGGGGDDAQEVRVADDPSTGGADEDRRATTTTADPTEVLGVVIERPEEPSAITTTTVRGRPATTVPVVTPETPAPTDPPLVCSNSFDPACGEFRWEPAVGNAPLVLSTASEITVAPDTTTTINVDWSDADGALRFDFFSPEGVLIGSGCSFTPRYGPWSPPAASPGSGSLAYAYTAPSTAGDHLVGISLGSGDCEGPYASEAHALITVHVVAP